MVFRAKPVGLRCDRPRAYGVPVKSVILPAAPRRHTVECVVTAGGLGAGVLAELLGMQPDLSGIALDTDVKLLSDLPRLTDALVLHTDGQFTSILRNRTLYTFLRGTSLPTSLTAWELEEGAGVGLIRLLAAVLLGYNLDQVKRRLRTWLERVLKRLHGPGAKRLVVHLAFSLCGGSGSALAIPVAALIRSIARSIVETLQIKIVAHVVGTSPFYGLLSTPLEQQRALANEATAQRELLFVQAPGNLAPLTAALGIMPLHCPLFDEVCYNDLADSGDCVQSLESLRVRIAGNILACTNHSLRLIEDTRDCNPTATQRGHALDHGRTAVFGSQSSDLLRAPHEKLTRAVAARVVAKRLGIAAQPVEAPQVETGAAALLPVLQVEQTRATVSARLRFDESLLPPPDRMTAREYLTADEVLMARWETRGRAEAAHRGRRLGDDLRREAEGRIQEFTAASRARCKSVPEYRAILDQCLEFLANRITAARLEVERLARANARSAHAKVRGDLQRAGMTRRAWSGRRLRDRLRAAFEAVVRGDAETVQHEHYRKDFLELMHAAILTELQTCERIEQMLIVNREKLEVDRARFEGVIGYRNENFVEVVAPEEVSDVLDQLETEVEARAGAAGELNFAHLLATRGDEDFAELLQSVGEQAAAACDVHLRLACGDLKGFIEHFHLEFDLNAWLKSRVEPTLPCKLNVAAYGPGHAPLRAYLVAPATMKSVCTSAIGETPNPAGFEFVPSVDDPFEVIVRAKISRVPFGCLPGLEEREAAFRQFRADAPRDRMWGYLESHGSLSPALDMKLVPDPNRTMDDTM